VGRGLSVRRPNTHMQVAWTIHFHVLENNKNVGTKQFHAQQLQHCCKISAWPLKWHDVAPIDCFSSYRVTRVPPSADHVKPNAARSVAQMTATAIKPRLQYFPRPPARQNKQCYLSHLSRAKNKSPTVKEIGFLFTKPKRTKIFHVCTLGSTKGSKTGNVGF